MGVLSLRRQILMAQPHKEKIVGDGIATFDTDFKAPMRVEIPFEPVQEGTGNPSLDNEMPISGWTGCEIGRCVSMLNGFTPDYDEGWAILSSSGTVNPYSAIGTACNNYIDVSNYLGKQVYLNHRPTGNAGGFAFYSDKSAASYITGIGNGGVTTQGEWIITIPDNPSIKYMRFTANTNYLDKVILCLVETKAILPINWQTEAGTIYGGTVTLNEDGSADVSVEWVSDVLNGRYGLALGPSYNTLDNSSAILFYWNHYQIKRRDNVNDIPYLFCPSLPVISRNSIRTYDDDSISCMVNGDGVFGIQLRLKAFKEMTTGSQANAYLRQNPINIVYLLNEGNNLRKTYHLPDVGRLKAFLGTNNIWSDLNGDPTVTFWKHG